MNNARRMLLLPLIRSGLAYATISLKTGVPLGTVKYWGSRYGKLSDQELKTLDAKRRGRLEQSQKKGNLAICEKWRKRREIVACKALREYKKFSKQPFFMFGLALYAGEGRKQDVVSMGNLDLKMLHVFILWCKRYLHARKFSGRIQMRDIHGYRGVCKSLSITLRNKIKWSEIPKKPDPRSVGAYPRAFGVVDIILVEVPMAWVRVNTWLQQAWKDWGA